MNAIKRILEQGWDDYESDLFPKDRRMKILSDEGIDGFNTENIRYLINELVKQFANPGTFLEVGTYRGSSLLSAALYNDEALCIGIDNFSEFEGFSINRYLHHNYNDEMASDKYNNFKILNKNLSKFNNLDNIRFINMEYREGLRELFSKNPGLKIDIFYYDGEHSHEEQYFALNFIRKHLAKRCLILVDDINWPEVRNTNNQFLEENPGFKSLLKITTSSNMSKTWWNGFEVIGRGF